MALRRCTCLGHIETDWLGKFVWVVDVRDWACPHPQHKEEKA